MAHTRLAHGLARRPGRSGFGGLAGLSHLTRQQMEGQLVAGWPRMVERPRESASRTTSVRGLISPGPDRRVPESITRPSPRPVAWGLLPSDEDEPAARTGRQAHHPGRHGTAPDHRLAGHVLVASSTIAMATSFPVVFPGALPTTSRTARRKLSQGHERRREDRATRVCGQSAAEAFGGVSARAHGTISIYSLVASPAATPAWGARSLPKGCSRKEQFPNRF